MRLSFCAHNNYTAFISSLPRGMSESWLSHFLLVSFAFNIGLKAFDASDVLAHLNSGDRILAAEAMSSCTRLIGMTKPRFLAEELQSEASSWARQVAGLVAQVAKLVA